MGSSALLIVCAVVYLLCTLGVYGLWTTGVRYVVKIHWRTLFLSFLWPVILVLWGILVGFELIDNHLFVSKDDED